MKVVMRVTLADVRLAKPKNIYYSIGTCWWTHDPRHLGRLPGGLPCDPLGSVLMMTRSGDAEGFLKAAENSSQHYGKHGLRAFIAAHHSNCIASSLDMRSAAARSWTEYNDALDRFDRFDQTLRRILDAIKSPTVEDFRQVN